MCAKTSKPKASSKREKRVDESHQLTGRRRGAVLKEEVWYEGEVVVKYSLAYINPVLCGLDNGRVLGYDNEHGFHHRHERGNVEPFEFTGYKDLAIRFQREVHAIWRSEDEKGE